MCEAGELYVRIGRNTAWRLASSQARRLYHRSLKIIVLLSFLLYALFYQYTVLNYLLYLILFFYIILYIISTCINTARARALLILILYIRHARATDKHHVIKSLASASARRLGALDSRSTRARGTGTPARA